MNNANGAILLEKKSELVAHVAHDWEDELRRQHN
jgi:hypothetical protein